MQEAFDFTSYARQVRKVSRALLCSGSTAAEISGLVHLLTVAMERDLARFGNERSASLVACGPGCGSCCIVNVAVLFPEAVAISRYVRRRFSAEEQEGLRARLRELLLRTSGLDDEERLYLRAPCAFLDGEGRCSIHPVRPLLCRSITSTDAQACRDGLAMVPLEGAPSVQMDLFHKQLVDTVFCEFGWALEVLGLDHRSLRLCAAVLALLEEPALVSLFVAGEKVPIH